jgi:metallo-beta-lactamase family protein
LLTHGHLDHIGRIPVLFKRGFRGKIIASSATLEIAKIVLLDSAKLMSEEYKLFLRKLGKKGKKKKSQNLFSEKRI